MPTLIPIHLDVEPEALGPVLLLLNGVKGVHGIAPNLDAVNKKPRRNGEDARQPRSGVNVNAVIIRELMDGQKNLQHLREKVATEGGSPASVSAALYSLSKKGVTAIVAPGVHALTAAAMEKLKLEQANNPAPQLSSPHSLSQPSRNDTKPFVFKAIQEGLSRAEIVERAIAAGITERAVGGALVRLMSAKEIHRIDAGKYGVGPSPAKSKKK